MDGTVRERCPQPTTRGPSRDSNDPAGDWSNRVVYLRKGTKGMEEQALLLSLSPARTDVFPGPVKSLQLQTTPLTTA